MRSALILLALLTLAAAPPPPSGVTPEGWRITLGPQLWPDRFQNAPMGTIFRRVADNPQFTWYSFALENPDTGLFVWRADDQVVLVMRDSIPQVERELYAVTPEANRVTLGRWAVWMPGDALARRRFKARGTIATMLVGAFEHPVRADSVVSVRIVSMRRITR